MTLQPSETISRLCSFPRKALGKNYKGLAQNYKALSFAYIAGSLPRKSPLRPSERAEKKEKARSSAWFPPLPNAKIIHFSAKSKSAFPRFNISRTAKVAGNHKSRSLSPDPSPKRAGRRRQKPGDPLRCVCWRRQKLGVLLSCVCWRRQKPEKPLAEDGAAPCCQASALVL